VVTAASRIAMQCTRNIINRDGGSKSVLLGEVDSTPGRGRGEQSRVGSRGKGGGKEYLRNLSLTSLLNYYHYTSSSNSTAHSSINRSALRINWKAHTHAHSSRRVEIGYMGVHTTTTASRSGKD